MATRMCTVCPQSILERTSLPDEANFCSSPALCSSVPYCVPGAGAGNVVWAESWPEMQETTSLVAQ